MEQNSVWGRTGPKFWRRRMKWLIPMAVLAIAASGPLQQAQAQGKKMYKCGSQFQDRPCDGGPPAAAAKPAAPAPQKTATAAEEQRRQIRCDNFGRQVLDMRQREKDEKNADAAKGIAAQRINLEA